MASRRRSACMSAGCTSGARSASLTTTRWAADSSGDSTGGRGVMSAPRSSTRSRPCQPRPTTAAGAPTVMEAHSGPISSATGTNSTAWKPEVHRRGNAVGGIRSDVDSRRCLTLSNTGPDSRRAIAGVTPADRRRSSSAAVAASSSAPMSAQTSSPSLASASEVYVTAPPSRQPLGSSGTTSREAAPTTSTTGESALNGYPSGPLPSASERPVVLLRAARRRR